MSPQIIELLVFAAIAFFIINKLISLLGSTDDANPKFKGSKFGEPSDMKDVTSSGKDWTLAAMLSKKEQREEIDTSFLVDGDNKELIAALEEVYNRMEKFSTSIFVKNAAKAWQMIIEALVASDNETLKELVDKRYIEQLQEKAEFYKNTNVKKLPDLKISDVTFFGNSIMIKVLVSVPSMPAEEWTYTRNLNQSGPNWFLSNIDQYIS